MRFSTAIILISMICGIAVLAYLGFWQLDRLTWKEGLISRVENNLASEAISVSAALTAAKKDVEFGVDYRPVKLAGNFLNAKPIFEFTTFGGKSGWNVYSLLEIKKGNNAYLKPLAVINRGFIEYDKKDEFDKIETSKDDMELVGLLRSPAAEQPSAAYDNDLEKRIFYWRDIAAMAKLWKKDDQTELNWYIDAGLPKTNYARNISPRPGTTLINFPNSHLQYAFTWFGLALALLGVGSYFLYSRRINNG